MQNDSANARIKDGKKAKRMGFLLLSLIGVSLFIAAVGGGGRYVPEWLDTLAMLTFFISVLSMPVFFIVGGVRAARAKRYRKYLPLIEWERDPESISVMAGIPANTVKKDIAAMIKARYIPGMIFNVSSAAPSGENAKNGSAENEVSVICPNCGASNSIGEGRTGECEYCGANVRGE